MCIAGWGWECVAPRPHGARQVTQACAHRPHRATQANYWILEKVGVSYGKKWTTCHVQNELISLLFEKSLAGDPYRIT